MKRTEIVWARLTKENMEFVGFLAEKFGLTKSYIIDAAVGDLKRRGKYNIVHAAKERDTVPKEGEATA